MGSAVYIGAIAVGSMIFNLIYWLFGFLRMGTSGMTSQALGRRDLAEVMRLFLIAVGLGVGIAMAFLLLQVPLRWLALYLMHPTADILPLAALYFSICIWGAPAVMGMNSLNGWFIGMQNSRIPMFISIMQNVVNILLSTMFVFGFGMKIEGVAFGTVLAQWTGFVAALLLWHHYYGRRLYLYFQFDNSSPSLWEGWGGFSLSSFFTVNRDIFLRTLCLVAVNLFFTSAGARQGAVVLSVNTLLMQLYILYSYVLDGFAFAGEAIGGRYYGARNRQAFALVVRRVFLWGAAVALLFTAAYSVGGSRFLRLLTDNATVIAATTDYYPWAVLIPVAGLTAFVWDGIYIGITATRAMLISAAAATALFFVAFFLLRPLLGNHALWLAFILWLLLRGLMQTLLFRSSSRALRQ